MTQPKVAIIGAGITGLTTAWYLQRAGINYQIFEKSDRVGGRVRTDILDGFILDHGFQIFFETYEEFEPLLDLESLRLGHFASGAIIFDKEERIEFGNPLFHISAISKLAEPWASVTDKIKLATLYVTEALNAAPFPPKGQMGAEFLQSKNFSDLAMRRLFRPFFGDVFLDRGLSPDANFFLYLFKKFATTKGSLPAGGMQAIPIQIAAQLKASTVHLNAAVKIDDIKSSYTHIVSTVPDKQSLPSAWHGTVNVYMRGHVDRNPGPLLLLNAEDELLRNACVISQAQPSYAPANQDLLSITLAPEASSYSDEQIVSMLRHKLKPWFGDMSNLNFVARFNIPHALPVSKPAPGNLPYLKNGNILYGGDGYTYPSLNGAAFSGRSIAECIITTTIANV